jgi:branched-chain amino acid transport system substrate-binding protein
MAIFRVFLLFLFAGTALASNGAPVLIGLDAEVGHKTSTSDEAIRWGIEIALDEINARGGVLGGRPLELVIRDNRSVPARGRDNLREFAAMPDLVAVFTGKFSPVVLEQIALTHQLKLPLLDPWAAADAITDNGYSPNFVFRLSLRDDWAIKTMLDSLAARKLTRIGVLLPNTSWGRSSQAAINSCVASHPGIQVTATHWYNWGDATLLPQYRAIERAGGKAVLLVANEAEGALLLREVAALPAERRLPIVSHWGVTGGDLAALAGDALKNVDFSVVQTYSFLDRGDALAARVAKAALAKSGKTEIGQVLSPVGLAHAYDLTHILARAIDIAAATDREKVRAALEQVRDYAGLLHLYRQPFTPRRHEALTANDPFMARYDGGSVPLRVQPGR